MSALTQKDSYKIDHRQQYPVGTTKIYSNFTARSGKNSNVPTNGITFIGLQHFILDYLIEEWNYSFFFRPKRKAVEKYQRRVSNILGFKVPVEHIEALHDLKYLPIKIKALPEGSFVPYGVPMLTIENTLPEFFWVTNMLESVLSAELWQPITSATTYTAYKKLAHKYAEITGGDKEFIRYQLHDFSFRGMAGRHAAATSGFAVLAAGSYGTDNIPAIDLAEEYYEANSDEEIVGVSVPATEHSVMCSGSKEQEFDTYKRLITEIYPTGIVSIVSDTWDFWQVVTDYLVRLKSDIMSRDGKVVIRPDSGDPVDILCGTNSSVEYLKTEDDLCDFLIDSESYEGHVFNYDGIFYRVEDVEGFIREYGYDQYSQVCNLRDMEDNYLITRVDVEDTPEAKGLIEYLWDIFGGTVTDKGYKVLDSHIGAIYGDSITYKRAEEIFRRLEAKGFASTNVVLGIGSFTYQYVTRDTHGMAMKATYAELNGVGTEIFKDPKTDSGIKKSAKGLLCVVKENDTFKLIDQVSKEVEETGCLEEVFSNGIIRKTVSLADIRKLTDSIV